MKKICFLSVLFMGMQSSMAVEEAPYEVVKKDGRYEVREYAPQILADMIIGGGAEEAGNQAFRPLFRYIDGDNTQKKKIAMTAPVSQEKVGSKWRVSFMMPAGRTMESLPVPENTAITLREKTAHRMAVVRYSGFWSEEKYLHNLGELRAWMKEHGIEPAGEPVWARYNAPFVPWFMRRNEVLIPIK